MQRNSLWLPRIVFGSLSLVTFGLGSWQVKRYWWKKNLFEERETKLHSPKIVLPGRVMKENEHHVAEASGSFQHEKECLIGPRPAPSYVPMHMLQWGGSVGYNVVTPFLRQNGEEPILVNRGWIPQRLATHKSRAKDDFYGNVTIEGIVSSGERPAISDSLGFKQPAYVLNLLSPVPPSGWPWPHKLEAFKDFTIMPSTHLLYVGTWYGLCITFAVLTWIKFGPQRIRARFS
ncbi:SURF1-like protein [Galdieria sulphuraria]|nr:SURF1-like protein [Galdieria sulphuraria]